MRIVQLLRGIGGEAHVVHTFVTDEDFPLAVYNPMLEDYGLVLVEGLGLQATPIGKVVGKFIELELRARTEAEQTEREAREITAEHVQAIAAANPLPLDAAAALAATMTASPAPARVPAGHIDPRTTALGASKAPMPHRGEGTTSSRPSDDVIIRPGRADGLGKTEVLEVRSDGALVKAPGWKPVQFEGEAVERASGPTEVLNENT